MVRSVQVHNQRESVALDMKAYSHLSAEERIRIDELRNREGLGVLQIALRISRGKSTVSREPRRGPWLASNENESYRPYRPKRLKDGRIRRYLPKRTSLDGLTDEDLQAIVQEINDTPMKVPDWETPNEAWYRELGKVMSKTSHPQTNVALTNR